MPPNNNPQYPGQQPGQLPQPVAPIQQVRPEQQQAPYHPRPVMPQGPQPTPTVTNAPQAGSPYDFFLEPGAAAKPKRAFSPGGMSGFTKLLIGAGAFMGLLAVLAIVMSAGRSGQEAPGTGLLAIAQSQQEIIRVSTLALPELDTQTMKGFAISAQSAITSSQNELIAYGEKSGNAINSKQLELTKNANNDKALETALAAGTYDSAFKSIMERILTDYQSKLTQTAAAATTEGTRDLLAKTLASAKLLLQMLTGVIATDPAATTPAAAP